MKGRFLLAFCRLLVLSVIAFLVGFGLNHLPPARESGIFWWGNSALPYLAVPLVGGRSLCKSRAASALFGAALSVVMMIGFYLQQFINERASERRLDISLTGFAWFLHVPWMYYGIVIGAVAGWLGARLRFGHIMAILGTAAMLEAAALALKLESRVPYLPMLWHSPPTAFGWNAQNLAGWAVEFGLGAALVATGIMRSRSRHRRAPAAASPALQGDSSSVPF